MLKGKRILVGVTGGIAAYKSAELVRQLVRKRATVHVVMTEGAQHFITPMTMQTLSGNPVGTSLWDLTHESKIGHIDLARDVDVMVVAPATANFIAKAANGIADDLLSTVMLATTVPIVFAPGMNKSMWDNPITRRNVATLKELRHITVVGPDAGELACGEEGNGRMSDPVTILDAVIYAARTEKDLAGEKVLISAGPTIEDIDPVRFLSNRSSGKMGLAMAREARSRGAEVTLVLGPTSRTIPWGVQTIKVRSASEMHAAVTDHARDAQVVIMTAAVADFSPSRTLTEKLKKEKAKSVPLLLEPTTDILRELGNQKGRKQFLVGFAAESQRILTNAKKKLKEKSLDLIVANDITNPHAGFSADTNIVRVIDRKGHTDEWPLLPKWEVSRRLFDTIQQKRAAAPSSRKRTTRSRSGGGGSRGTSSRGGSRSTSRGGSRKPKADAATENAAPAKQTATKPAPSKPATTKPEPKPET